MNVNAEQTASIITVDHDRRIIRRRTRATLIPYTIPGRGKSIPREIAVEALDVVETVLQDLGEVGRASEIRVGNIEIGTGGWEVLGVINLAVG